MKSAKIFTYVSGCMLMLCFFLAAPQSSYAQKNDNLFHLVLDGNAQGLSDAISNGADVNMQSRVGNTPLITAAKIGDKEVISVLLSSDADVNIQNRAGATALILAAKYGTANVVTALLDHGADPTIATHKGYTASVFAKGYKHQAIFEQLQKAEGTYNAIANN